MMKLHTKAHRILTEKLMDGMQNVGDSRKINNAAGAFMACCVEIIGKNAVGTLVSVAHYMELNGDLCADPDVVILITKDGAYPATFQQAIPPVHQEAIWFSEGDTIHCNEKLQQQICLFVNELLVNIADQQGLD